jgi:hypothetical protein
MRGVRRRVGAPAGKILFPATAAQWAASYPSVPTPLHGHVYNTGAMPIPDNFGSVPMDVSNGSPDHAAAWKGRGGGLCVEATTTADALNTTLTNFWDVATGDWALWLSWWRGGETGGASNHKLCAKGVPAAPSNRVIIWERANATQNWLLPALNNGSTSKAALLSLTADPADLTYDTGVDTLVTRLGTALHCWTWFANAPDVAYHEEGVLDAADNGSALSDSFGIMSSADGSVLVGRQFMADYLWKQALTRAHGDTIRGDATTSQVEA